LASVGSTVVDHVPQHPKVKGSRSDAATGTGEKMVKVVFCYLPSLLSCIVKYRCKSFFVIDPWTNSAFDIAAKDSVF
jgi:hypothetical protein